MTVFYQLRLSKKGSVEIFENVFSHRVDLKRDVIAIKYSIIQSIELNKVTTRKVSEYYSIEKESDPQYEYKQSFPKGTSVKIHVGMSRH